MKLDCPEGYTQKLVKEFKNLRLKRASKNCLRGFSICENSVWVLRCVDEFGQSPPQDYPSYSYTNKSSNVVVDILPNNKLQFRFPIDLLRDPSFIASDFNDFGFDTDYNMGNGYIAKAGNYTPTYTATEIRIIVDKLP